MFITHLDDMWLLHKLKEGEIENMSCGREIEDGWTPRDNCYAPYAGQPKDSLGIVDNGTIHRAVEETLLPIIQNCFDRDPEIAPSTSEEPFGSLVERDGKFAKRVVFAVHQM